MTARTDRMTTVGAALVALALLGLVALISSGCGHTLPSLLEDASIGIKTVGPVIETPLKAACEARWATCQASLIAAAQCGPLTECKSWAASYVVAAKTAQDALAAINRLVDTLTKAGVLK